MRRLCYLEDDQYYTIQPFFFDTDCPYTPEELRKVSFRRVGAGRFGTPFSFLQEELIKEGYICDLIEKGLKYGSGVADAVGPFPSISVYDIKEIEGIPVVKGAEGNY